MREGLEEFFDIIEFAKQLMLKLKNKSIGNPPVLFEIWDLDGNHKWETECQYLDVDYRNFAGFGVRGHLEAMVLSDKRTNSCGIIQGEIMRNECDEQSDFSQNKLDIAFIAEDSREVRSVSMSGSEVESISGISRIQSNQHPSSPFFNTDPDIGSMQEWPQESPCLFGNSLRSRNSRKNDQIPQEIQESNEDEREIEKMSKCTKKRIGEKMKVITVGATTPIIYPYQLRSKKLKGQEVQRLENSDDNSSDELRQIVDQIGKSSANHGSKCKPTLNQQSRMV